MIYAGIDPGLGGAVSFINEEGGICAVVDTPTVVVEINKKKRRDYVIPEMARLFMGHRNELCVTLEKVGAMPGQGVTSMFSFGRGLGLWEGILNALLIPYTMVRPVTWKKAMLGDMGKAKSMARLRAMQLFPSATGQLSRKKDDGRAEALLLAEYGRRLRKEQ